MSKLATLALISGLLCALAPLAQAARIARTGSAQDVSLIWLALYAIGSAVWLSYGLAIDSLPLAVSQSTALICVTVALLLAARHRRVDGHVAETPPAPRPSRRRPSPAEAHHTHANPPERPVRRRLSP